jgi:hypothetical protein
MKAGYIPHSFAVFVPNGTALKNFNYSSPEFWFKVTPAERTKQIFLKGFAGVYIMNVAKEKFHGLNRIL